MGRHTDGPWMLTEDHTYVVAGYDDRTIAEIWPVDGPANARLIAAAPDLLKALDLFVKQWNACGPNSDFGSHFGNVRDAAVAAIAKAGGA